LICSFAFLDLYYQQLNDALHSSIEGANNRRSKLGEQKTIAKSEKVGTWNSKVHIRKASMPL
jgi:hypothetical protein